MASLPPQELEQLYTRHAPVLYAEVLKLVKHRDAAEDIVQEVFERALRQPDWTAIHSPSAWLQRVAANRAIDYLRRGQHRAWHLYGDPQDLPAALPLDGAPLEERLLDCVRQLAQGDQEILQARYTSGRSMADLAQHYRTTPGAIKIRAYRARQRLLQLLARAGVTAEDYHAFQEESS